MNRPKRLPDGLACLVAVGVLLSATMVACAPAHAATPLTCDLFRDRLNGSLIISQAGSAEAPVFRETGTGVDGSKRYAWQTPNLEGSLMCSGSADFKEFFVELKVANRERFVDQIKRFVTTNGAAICAIGEAPLPACEDIGKHMLQIGLDQMGTAFKKRVTAPSGIASNTLLPQVRADMTVTPSFLTFALGVREGTTADAVRQPLSPSQPDAKP